MITRHLYPLISCICITHNRPAFLLRAIIYFDSQNYPNRELIISYPADDISSKNLIENIKKMSGLNLIGLERESYLTVGMARNDAVLKCNGEYICTWDDDDWYSDLRLMSQYSSLFVASRKSSIITQVILYDKLTENACLSGSYPLTPYHWAGTLLCKKQLVMKYPYTTENIGEDYPLIKYLLMNDEVEKLADHSLYAFIYHGGNVWNAHEFGYFMQKGKALEPENRDRMIKLIMPEFDLTSS